MRSPNLVHTACGMILICESVHEMASVHVAEMIYSPKITINAVEMTIGSTPPSKTLSNTMGNDSLMTVFCGKH